MTRSGVRKLICSAPSRARARFTLDLASAWMRSVLSNEPWWLEEGRADTAKRKQLDGWVLFFASRRIRNPAGLVKKPPDCESGLVLSYCGLHIH